MTGDEQERTALIQSDTDVTGTVAAAGCPGLAERLKVSEVLQRIGDKWALMVIMLLADRSRRFGELRREIEGVSQRMLTLTLRHLERDGIVSRTVTPSIPPRVDYELTAIGRSLAGPVRTLGGWALANLDGIGDARRFFDERRAGEGRGSAGVLER